jgi:hypothetical protein
MRTAGIRRGTLCSPFAKLISFSALALLLLSTAGWSDEPAADAVPAKSSTKTAGRALLKVIGLLGNNSPKATEATPATHAQTKVIHLADAGDWKLASFCLTKDGKIVAVVNRQDGNAHGGLIFTFGNESSDKPNAQAAEAKPKAGPAQVRILDADGKQVSQFALDFLAQAVNLCPDGTLAIGGDGVLARYDLTGKELARAESPHLAAARKDPEETKRQARETLEQQRSSIKEALKGLEAQKEEIAKKDDASLTNEEKEQKRNLDQIIAAYKQMAGNSDKPVTDAEVEQMMQQQNAQGRRVNAVAASSKYFFCTAPASKGYGYSVWRTDMDFGNPKRIADGLSGCCGQMDIQCCGDEVVVAENSRKRVVCFDSEGKEVNSWGKGSRDGEGDTFGSCCNPMNTRAAGGKLYVSDSDGRVRLFSLDGGYEGEVGKAEVNPGCKSSIVDISPDGNRLYYIDVNNSAICVLDRKPKDATAAVR